VQARWYQGEEARLAVKGVISCLIRIGKLHPEYIADRVAPNFLARKTELLHGRDEEMRWLQERLGTERTFSAAVIRGGAGDGKSAIAMEFGMQLYEAGQLPGGAYVVNMTGPFPNENSLQCAGQLYHRHGSLHIVLRGAIRTHVQCLPCRQLLRGKCCECFRLGADGHRRRVAQSALTEPGMTGTTCCSSYSLCCKPKRDLLQPENKP
jgi:hypothetical protein